VHFVRKLASFATSVRAAYADRIASLARLRLINRPGQLISPPMLPTGRG
jgi:hypothetical protein